MRGECRRRTRVHNFDRWCKKPEEEAMDVMIKVEEEEEVEEEEAASAILTADALSCSRENLLVCCSSPRAMATAI